MKAPDVVSFDSDLMAAVMVGVPIELDGPQSNARRTRLTTATLETLPKQPPSQQPTRYRAAREVFARLGNSELIIHALSARASATAEAIRVMRWPVTYVTIVAFFATIGLIFFALSLMPLIDETRAELAIGTNINQPIYSADTNWVQPVMIAAAIAFGVLVLATCFGGIRRLAMWFGGTVFVRSRVAAAAARIASLLENDGMPTENARQLAFDVSGADQPTQQVVTQAMGGLNVPFGETETLCGSDALADYFLVAGDRCLARMRSMAPALFVLLIGGSIAAAYAVAVYLPVIQLLRDICFTGV